MPSQGRRTPITFTLHKVYDNPRDDILALIPRSAIRILDVGCATGRLGAALKEQRPERKVIGVEPSDAAREQAALRLDQVVTPEELGRLLPSWQQSFDCLIYGDVLEHLPDPWSIVSSHRPLLRAQGLAIATCPNAQCWRIWLPFIRGTWSYADGGLRDIGHLRWFTGSTLSTLFRHAGYSTVEIVHKPLRGKSGLLNRASLGRLRDILEDKITLIARVE
ncbi:MAG: class I SAM-dependent methyltransferase [Chloroflexi bacterium]|nr:class I SAM-dependent methyltransferase [Chloroflexota bacterium]